MLKPGVVALVFAAPSLASARPLVTAGVSLGLTEAQADANSGNGSNETLGIFGRLNLTARVAGQLELQRIESDATGIDIRTGTALIVVDLGSGGRLMPIMLAGIGFDAASDQYGDSTSGYHLEGGFGLEYRADGGLTFGGDARMGGRSLSTSQGGLDSLHADHAQRR